MILQALTAYYEQLLKQGKVEAPGWDSKFKVSYELRLGPDGQLLALNDLRQEPHDPVFGGGADLPSHAVR